MKSLLAMYLQHMNSVCAYSYEHVCNVIFIAMLFRSCLE